MGRLKLHLVSLSCRMIFLGRCWIWGR